MISSIHTFLVSPTRNAEPSENIKATTVPLEGLLYEQMKEIFDSSDDECDIPIHFRHDEEGLQNNVVRDMVQAYAEAPSEDTGLAIAHALEQATPKVSGLGLLFLIHGIYGGQTKTVVSRFPADKGIMADDTDDRLSVTFTDRVFLKSAHSYKAAVYIDAGEPGSGWHGRATDKQISGNRQDLSDYWIDGFLKSSYVTTPVAGTKRVGKAIKAALSRTGDQTVKKELTAFSMLVDGLDGQMKSAANLPINLPFLILRKNSSKAVWVVKTFTKRNSNLIRKLSVPSRSSSFTSWITELLWQRDPASSMI